MNAVEANVLLTKVALFDGRFKRAPEEQAAMAREWSVVLDDVLLTDAVEAVRQHYRQSSAGVSPALIRELVEDVVVPDITARRERAERDAWLRRNGVDPEQFDAAVAAGTQPRDVLLRAGVNAKELDA